MSDPVTRPRRPLIDTHEHTAALGSAVVVGGGWSGIAAAWYLYRAGYRVTLYDSGTALGGRSASALLGGRTVTLGGKNIGVKYSLFREFVAAMGGGPFEHFGINTSRIENGRVVTVDGNAKARAALGLIRHTPVRDAVRLFRMIRLIRADEANRFLGGPGFVDLADRQGDPSLDRVLGPYLRDQMVRAMTVRMNGAEPDEVFLGTFGTNLGMLLDRFEQLTSGFEPTFREFSSRIDARLRATVRRILTAGSHAIGVEVDADGTVTEELADLVVVALPAAAAAALLQPFNAELAVALREIRYYPVAVAMAEYTEPAFTEEVRALVFGPDSLLSNAGAYGMHDRHIVRYTFSGRAVRPLLDGQPDITTLVECGEAALDRHIPVASATRRHVTGAVWPDGLCAYGPRHDDRLARVARERDRLSNLVLTGDYVRGASIEACFRAAHAGTARWTAATESVTST